MRKPFYGWVIVGVTFLIGISEAGVFQNILSIFLKPMTNDFGWSRASIAGAMSFGSICGGILSIIFGPILDRYGPRMIAFISISLLSAGLVAMSFINRLWELYFFFGVGRMIAVGILALTIPVSISNWFFRLRGRAMGIARIGDRFGSTVLPLGVQMAIMALGWRRAWIFLGVVVFIMSGIPSLIFLRRRPEDMGLLPDGVAAPAEAIKSADSLKSKAQSTVRSGHSEPVWSRSQAIRTRAFWLLTSLNTFIPFLQAGINFHVYPFLTDRGIDGMTAALVVSTISVFGMVGSAFWGRLSERFPIKTLMAANLWASGLVFLLFWWTVRSEAFSGLGISAIFLLAGLHGILHGGRNPMINLGYANFFGRRSLGSIFGLAHPFHTTANAIGPVFAAFCFDIFGSYEIPFCLFVILFFLSGLIALPLNPPRQ